jgi:predicted nucleic acid-binding protein
VNVVDSSGWLEYFAGGRHARTFEPALEDLESLIVPAVSVYEVFKVLLREAGEEPAIQGVAAMQRGRIIDLTVQRALDAAALSLRHSLPMADSIILATARDRQARLHTMDSDFRGIAEVEWLEALP